MFSVLRGEWRSFELSTIAGVTEKTSVVKNIKFLSSISTLGITSKFALLSLMKNGCFHTANIGQQCVARVTKG